MDDAEDVLRKNSSRLRKELEAKPLLLEIGHKFIPSTRQEIERTIDREGNIIAMEILLEKLKMRDNWVKTLYNALNGKVINKPNLAKLFEPFLNEDSSQEQSLSLGQSLPSGPILSSGPSLSLETCLKDVPAFRATWESHINMYGLHPEATVHNLMDKMFLNDSIAYEKIKKATGIRHSYVRQASDQESLSLSEQTEPTDFDGRFPTQTSEISALTTSSKSLPVASNIQNDALSSGSSILPQPDIASLRGGIYEQENAFEKIATNQAQENATQSFPTTNVRTFPVTVNGDSSLSFSTMPAPKSKREVPEVVAISDRKVPEVVATGDGKLPEVVEDRGREVPEIVAISDRKLPEVVEDRSREVPEVVEDCGREVPEVVEDRGREVPEVVEDRGREVPEVVAISDRKVPEVVATGDKKLPEVVEDRGREVPGVFAMGNRKVPEVVEDHGREVPEVVPIGDREVPEVVEDHSREVPEVVEDHSREVPDVVEDRGREVPDVVVAREPSFIPQNLGVLAIAIGVGFSLGYFLRR